MFVCKLARFFDVRGGKDLAGEVRFDYVLQSSDYRVIKKTAARTNVGINESRVERVLPPMRELVAIGVEDGIEPKGLDVDLLIDAMTRAAAVRRTLSRLFQRESHEQQALFTLDLQDDGRAGWQRL
jgi:hypothetical protein